MVLMANVCFATCNTSWFVLLEQIAAKRYAQGLFVAVALPQFVIFTLLGKLLPLPWYLAAVDDVFNCLCCSKRSQKSGVTEEAAARPQVEASANERPSDPNLARAAAVDNIPMQQNALRALILEVILSLQCLSNELQLHALIGRIDGVLSPKALGDAALSIAPMKLWRRTIRRLELLFMLAHLSVNVIVLGVLFSGLSRRT